MPKRRTLVVGALAGCAALAAATTLATPKTGPAPLDDLRVEAETDGGTYRRDAFGGWLTADRCDTRERVLLDESLTTPMTTPDCRPVSGEWASVYDGQRTTDPRGLDVDHVVPLAEAWVSGASSWSAERRRAFANDLDHPAALLAVTAASNRAKGDQDPAEWLPPDLDSHCQYVTWWIDQKAAWDLSVDVAERDALADVLAACP